jgi:hypothetical protein
MNFINFCIWILLCLILIELVLIKTTLEDIKDKLKRK